MHGIQVDQLQHIWTLVHIIIDVLKEHKSASCHCWQHGLYHQAQGLSISPQGQMKTKITTVTKPATQRVQALADSSCSALYALALYKAIRLHTCMLSQQRNRAPIANPPNSAQLEGTSYHSPCYIRVHAVVWMRWGTDRQTHTLCPQKNGPPKACFKIFKISKLCAISI